MEERSTDNHEKTLTPTPEGEAESLQSKKPAFEVARISEFQIFWRIFLMLPVAQWYAQHRFVSMVAVVGKFGRRGNSGLSGPISKRLLLWSNLHLPPRILKRELRRNLSTMEMTNRALLRGILTISTLSVVRAGGSAASIRSDPPKEEALSTSPCRTVEAETRSVASGSPRAIHRKSGMPPRHDLARRYKGCVSSAGLTAVPAFRKIGPPDRPKQAVVHLASGPPR